MKYNVINVVKDLKLFYNALNIWFSIYNNIWIFI